MKYMRERMRKLGVSLLVLGILLGWGSIAYPNGQKQPSEPRPGTGKFFSIRPRGLAFQSSKLPLKLKMDPQSRGD